jgi:hypothetical protein
MAYEGTIGGVASGASMGASIGGPWGALIGAAAGGIYGATQDQKAAKAQADAERLAASVPNVDPRMLSHLQDIQLKQKFLAAGTSSEFAIGKRNIDQINATTGANLARTTGGNTAGLIDSLLSSERQADARLNELSSNLASQGIGMLGMQTPIISDMADRTLALQLAPVDRAYSYAAEMGRDNQANAYAGIASLPGLFQGDPKVTPSMLDAYMAPPAQSAAPAQPAQPAGYDPSYYEQGPVDAPVDPFMQQPDNSPYYG